MVVKLLGEKRVTSASEEARVEYEFSNSSLQALTLSSHTSLSHLGNCPILNAEHRRPQLTRHESAAAAFPAGLCS